MSTFYLDSHSIGSLNHTFLRALITTTRNQPSHFLMLCKTNAHRFHSSHFLVFGECSNDILEDARLTFPPPRNCSVTSLSPFYHENGMSCLSSSSADVKSITWCCLHFPEDTLPRSRTKSPTMKSPAMTVSASQVKPATFDTACRLFSVLSVPLYYAGRISLRLGECSLDPGPSCISLARPGV